MDTLKDIRLADETDDIEAAAARVKENYSLGLATIDDVKAVLARAKRHLTKLEERLHEQQSTSRLQGS